MVAGAASWRCSRRQHEYRLLVQSERRTVPPGPLGLVKSLVSGGDEAVALRALPRCGCDTGAHGHLGHAAETSDCGSHPLDDHERSGARTVGKHDGKLLASVAGNQVDIAHAARQRARDLSEHFVAGYVPEGVVDVLEVVNVDQRHRQRLFGPYRSRHFPAERKVELAAVRQARKASDDASLATSAWRSALFIVNAAWTAKRFSMSSDRRLTRLEKGGPASPRRRPRRS